jgi:hypothetical protein
MASFCDAQARAEVQDPSKLEWSDCLPYGRLSTSKVTTQRKERVHPQSRIDVLRSIHTVTSLSI